MSKDAISPSGATDPQGQLRSPVEKPSVSKGEKQEPLRVEAENEQDLKGGQTQGLDYSGAHEKVDPREIALVKKLDRWMMPILWLMYWLNYLDRNAITLARLNNLEKDLNLQPGEYQTCISILFVGYIIMQLPSNMMLTRVRPSVWMSSWMVLWAVVSTLTAVANNYTGLLLTRFFLGVTEAPYYPGALYMLAQFYTRKEIATRIAVLYTGNILATAFAGLIAIGIFEMDGAAGLSGWRWLFIIQGLATLVVAVASFWLLPDEPLQTRWLTDDERQLAHARIVRDTVGEKGVTTTFRGMLEAARDGRVWLFALMQHLHLGANGFKNFFPTAVKTLGFGQTVTLALTCPPYLIAGVTAICWSWSSGRRNERTWHLTVGKSLAVAGFVLGCATLNTGARYFAMIVFTVGTYSANSIILGWVASTCSQTKEKKASSLAIANMAAAMSFIWTPYLWPDWDEPRYVIAMSSSAALSVATILCAWAMRWWLRAMNKKIRASDDEAVMFYAY
ncbi:hypothetical protein PoMZ_01653 [Pyricularia oryzae]|uniref:Major facilitator superfamily (MFS) profile domain-containing protein n=1 Tax=Pyricularia oryzae TaxID=318829 RepID=A0A4P7N2Q9_PYROR|nr:hypothetical protein PoMZ_01653 [Pyricularia oryzae]